MLPILTNDDLSILSDFHKQAENGHPEGHTIALHPSDQQHEQLIQVVLKASGYTRDKYPHLFDTIINSSGAAPRIAHHMRIVDAGKTIHGKATAMVWAASEEPSLYSGASVMVFDGNANELLGFGNSTDVQTGMLQAGINARTARPATSSANILGVSFTVRNDGVANFTAIAGSRVINLDDTDSLSINLDAPKIAAAHLPPNPPPHHHSIHIAVGRDKHHPNPDADYFYTETTNKNDPNLIVPFKGSADLPYTIKSGTTGSTIEAESMIYVDFGTRTAQMMQLDQEYTTPSKVAAAITVNESENTVSWDFPYDQKGYATTGSLVYPNGPVNHKQSYFNFQFVVPVTNGPSPAHTYVFSVYSYVSGGGSQPFTGSETGTHIPALKFWWCCLAAGTEVTMADKSLINIEDLSNHDRVSIDAHEATLGIEKTTLGHHEAKTGQSGLEGIYRLKTEDGKSLIATGAHPIMTPNGAIACCYLNAGDTVLVTEGTSKVSSCDAIVYSGMFHGLKLEDAEDRAQSAPRPVCAFYANGIYVGDHVAMINQLDKQRLDLEFTLPNIDSKLHTDYTSAVHGRNQ